MEVHVLNQHYGSDDDYNHDSNEEEIVGFPRKYTTETDVSAATTHDREDIMTLTEHDYFNDSGSNVHDSEQHI